MKISKSFLQNKNKLNLLFNKKKICFPKSVWIQSKNNILLNNSSNFYFNNKKSFSSTIRNEEEDANEEGNDGYINSEDELNNMKKEEMDLLDKIPLQNADDHYRRALVLKEQGNIAKALKHLEEAIKMDSTDYRYYTMRGSCYEEMNQLDLAINDYTKVTSTQPQNYPAFLATAQCYMKKGIVRILSKKKKKKDSENLNL